MFAVGHLALGYLTGKASSKLLGVDVNIPLLFFSSVVPDIDFLVGLEHRGPTHSLVLYAIVFVPLLIMFGKGTLVYLVTLSQHVLLGDFLTGGGVQILWPLSSTFYGADICMMSLLNIYLEWTVFLLSFALMLKTRDVQKLLQHHSSNLLSTVPVFAIILPVFLSFPLSVPLGLVIPHLIYLTLFGVSILIDLTTVLKKA